MEKIRYQNTIQDLQDLDRATYCELGPGRGVISLGLQAKGKKVVTVEAPWAVEENKAWAEENGINMYLFEFFTGDFSLIKDDVDCFILAHAIAHFRFSPYILFDKIYNALPSGGMFYLSTVNATSFERVMQFYRGEPIVQKVTQHIDKGFLEVLKDFNKTDMRQIWDDWMHVKEYTKPEIEEMFVNSGFEIHKSFYRNNFTHWKRNIVVKLKPHLSEEIIVIGKKP